MPKTPFIPDTVSSLVQISFLHSVALVDYPDLCREGIKLDFHNFEENTSVLKSHIYGFGSIRIGSKSLNGHGFPKEKNECFNALEV